MVSENEVRDALRQCTDPEIGVNIVDLGLVYGIKINGNGVVVEMTLTTPACPMCSFFVKEVEERVKMVPGVNSVEVKLVWDPPWSPDRISAEAKRQLGIEK